VANAVPQDFMITARISGGLSGSKLIARGQIYASVSGARVHG